MAGIARRLRQALPWWARIGAKLVLSRLPLGGGAWQRLGLFSPGQMLDPDYAIGVFRMHHDRAGRPGPGFSFLELGPGDTLASALVGYACGAARCWLVDAGGYATPDIAVYRHLLDRLRTAFPAADFAALDSAGSLDALLAASHAVWLQDGIHSLAMVPAESCDFVFSNAVLEHVPRAEFDATIAETYRILRPAGRSSHHVDYADHLGGGLDNLRFPERLWEAPWFAQRSGFYTNRLRPSEVVAAFRRAGFAVAEAAVDRWPHPPIASRALAPGFRRPAPDDLLIRNALYVLTPEPRGTARA